MASDKSRSWVTNDHIKAILQQPHLLGFIGGYKDLTPLHSEWVHYIWNAKKGVSLMAHRGSFKSSGVTVTGAVWRLLFNPEEQIMIVRKTHAEAVDTVADIAKMMKNPEIREIFKYAHGETPEFTMERIGEGKLSFSFKTGTSIAPSLLGMGLNSPLTGKHATYIVADDLSTLKDRLSRAEREFTKNIWRELSSNVINRDCPCCYIGTPWTTSNGVEEIIPEPIKYDCYSTGLISEKQLIEIKSKTIPTLFACNYELKIVADEKAMFKNPKYDAWDFKAKERPYAQIDPAFGGEDFNAFTIMGRRDDGALQAIGFAKQGVVGEWLDFFKQQCKKYKVQSVYIELNSDRGWTASQLKNLGIIAKTYNESTKKQFKIATYLWEVWEQLYWVNLDDDPMRLDYMAQITNWESEAKCWDDAPDSASSLVRARFSKKASMTGRWGW